MSTSKLLLVSGSTDLLPRPQRRSHRATDHDVQRPSHFGSACSSLPVTPRHATTVTFCIPLTRFHPHQQMETFHILHLASCWDIEAQADSAEAPPPIPHAPTAPSIAPSQAPSSQTRIPDVAASSSTEGTRPLRPPPRIRAAAAQMVFASRTSQDFITPEQVALIEAWAGRAVLEALIALVVEPDVSTTTSTSSRVSH